MSSSHEQTVVSHHHVGQGSAQSYTIGFILSVILTLIPFAIVVKGLLSGWLLVGMLVAFAIGQLLVQLVFFLHLGKGSGSRWNIIMFLFMAMVVIIIVVGSLWIMANLDYNMMPDEVDEILLEEEGFQTEDGSNY